MVAFIHIVFMRIGIVSLWFNRGQATVSRHLRSILDQLGHQTFILARPTPSKPGGLVKPSFIANNDVWGQERVTHASAHDIPAEEYAAWAKNNALDVIFFDQNYQFEPIAQLRRKGIVTIGRFVWESFAEEHAKPAAEALSVIYSLTRAEQKRYQRMGIESPLLRWGCHPELLAHKLSRKNQGKSFLYVGGYLSTRKPTGTTIAAFRQVADPSTRLTIKTQRSIEASDLVIPDTFEDLHSKKGNDLGQIHQDPRISLQTGDFDTAAYYRFFSAFDVSLAPSRWEGLGLHLYEALAFGIPTISCDIPPINEVIIDQYNGLLVECRLIGHRKSGIPAYEPDQKSLQEAMETMANQDVAGRLALNASQSAEQHNWRHAVTAFDSLFSSIS
ncbi:MAG: glycosyltransferase family 4 protein [Verrucomicrobiales bacterium]